MVRSKFPSLTSSHTVYRVMHQGPNGLVWMRDAFVADLIVCTGDPDLDETVFHKLETRLRKDIDAAAHQIQASKAV